MQHARTHMDESIENTRARRPSVRRSADARVNYVIAARPMNAPCTGRTDSSLKKGGETILGGS